MKAFKTAIRQALPVLLFVLAFIALVISFSSCSRYLSFTDKAGTDWHVQGNRIESVDSLGNYQSRKIPKAYDDFNYMGSLDSLLMKSVVQK